MPMRILDQLAYRALAMAAVQAMPALGQGPAILVDTDNMHACIFRMGEDGMCQILAQHHETIAEDFFTAAARSTACQEDGLYSLCCRQSKQLKRYLRRGKTEDVPLSDLPPYSGIGCKQLTDLYDSQFAPPLKRTVETIRQQADDSLPVVAVGRLAAFYPAEHTLREMLSLMPFAPVVAGLVTDQALAISSQVLISRGTALISQLEQAKRQLAHNIALQLKRADGAGLRNWLHLLAQKGSNLHNLQDPVYSDLVLIAADEPLVLFADSTPYTIRLPRSVFSRKAPVIAARFALGVAEDVPKLLVKTADGVTTVDIHTTMYKEA